MYLGVCVLVLPVSSVKPREPERFQEEFRGRLCVDFRLDFCFAFDFLNNGDVVDCGAAWRARFTRGLTRYVYILIYTHVCNICILNVPSLVVCPRRLAVALSTAALVAHPS